MVKLCIVQDAKAKIASVIPFKHQITEPQSYEAEATGMTDAILANVCSLGQCIIARIGQKVSEHQLHGTYKTKTNLLWAC